MDNVPVQAGACAEVGGSDAPGVFRPKKDYPNRQINEDGTLLNEAKMSANALSVWVFPVIVYEDGVKRPSFEVTTDMGWRTFKDKVYARIDAVDVRLNYRIYADCSAWLDLNCEADLTVAMACVQKKALVARTRVVTMEVKNAVSDGRFLTKKCAYLGCSSKNRGDARGEKKNEAARTTYLRSLHSR